MNTMIISGIVTGVAAVTTLVSGVVFKRAFDVHNQAPHIMPIAQIRPDGIPPSDAQHARASSERASVGEVKSSDQKGGVTAGYVGSINQGPPQN